MLIFSPNQMVFVWVTREFSFSNAPRCWICEFEVLIIVAFRNVRFAVWRRPSHGRTASRRTWQSTRALSTLVVFFKKHCTLIFRRFFSSVELSALGGWLICWMNLKKSVWLGNTWQLVNTHQFLFVFTMSVASETDLPSFPGVNYWRPQCSSGVWAITRAGN